VMEKLHAVTLEDVVDLANDIFIEDKLTFVSLGRIDQNSLHLTPVS